MWFASTAKGVGVLDNYYHMCQKINDSNMFAHWYSWKCDTVKRF